MKKTKFLLTLLMAVVMMAMSPAKVWAETDARLAQLTLTEGVTATIADGDDHPWVIVTPGEKLNNNPLPDKITNGLRSSLASTSTTEAIHGTTSTTTITLDAKNAFTLSFKVYCKSEREYDYCYVYVDNNMVCRLNEYSDDPTDYEYNQQLTSGEHTIKLYYRKDGSSSTGIDSGVLYDFVACATHTFNTYTNKCDRCGAITEHTHAFPESSEVAANCTEASKSHCSLCGELLDDGKNAALDHDYPETYTDGVIACTRCHIVKEIQPATQVTAENYASLDLTAENYAGYVDYYAIGNAGQLAWFRNFVNTSVTVGETTTYPNASANAVLTADIDMSPVCHAANTTTGVAKLSWEPIGATYQSTYLGILDGNNHKVTNLYIDTDNSNVGFIGILGKSDEQTNATVKNLTIRGSVKSSKNNIGGIVGYLYGIVSGCTNYATVEGTGSDSYNIGGIAGFCGSYTVTAKIENCVNHGEITCNSQTSSAKIAGIAGFAINTEIINCCNDAKVETLGKFVGGIVGQTDGNSAIKKSTNSGNIISNYTQICSVAGIVGYSGESLIIEECKNSGNVTGVGEQIGGIVGYAYRSTRIKNCVNEGAITSTTGNNYYSNIGGIAGLISASSNLLEMSGCYNTGTISADDEYVGGIAGSIYDTNSGSYIKDCYTTGSISSTATQRYAYIGGAFGNVYVPIVSNVYSVATITKNADATAGVGAFAGCVHSTLSNCYFDSNKTDLNFNGDVTGSTIDASVNGGKCTTAFASGEVAYLLNGSRSAGTAESPLVWYQAIGADAYPTLDQNEYTIVKYDASNGYYNDIENFASITLQDGVAYEAKLKRTATSLTYTRTFTGTNWTTWYVPFDLTLTDDICAKYAFSRINNVHQYDDDDNGTADRTVIESFRQKSGVTLKANYPYLVKALTDGDKTMELTLTDVTVAQADENSIDCQSVDYSYTFTGTYAAMGNSGSTKYSLFDDTETWMHFYSLDPQRHYMTITSRSGNTSNPAPERVVLDVIGDEDAMGIVTVYADREAADCREGKMLIDGRIVVVKNGKWYNTEGQQIR